MVNIDPAVVLSKKPEAPAVAVEDIVIWPLEAEAIVMSVPAAMYDLPSESRVSAPERLVTVIAFVVLLNVNAESPPKFPKSLN